MMITLLLVEALTYPLKTKAQDSLYVVSGNFNNDII